MTGSLDYPALLDRHEAAARRECVLDDLYRQYVALGARRVEALATMQEANAAGDDDAWDRAAGLHDECSDEIADIKKRIDELEDIEARAEERSLRGWAQWATR